MIIEKHRALIIPWLRIQYLKSKTNMLITYWHKCEEKIGNSKYSSHIKHIQLHMCSILFHLPCNYFLIFNEFRSKWFRIEWISSIVGDCTEFDRVKANLTQVDFFCWKMDVTDGKYAEIGDETFLIVIIAITLIRSPLLHFCSPLTLSFDLLRCWKVPS